MYEMWNDRKQRQQGTVMMGEAACVNTIHIHLICQSMFINNVNRNCSALVQWIWDPVCWSKL